VSLDRYVKQLKREAKRNPQKAGALALLLVVAAWFWLPLIWPAKETPPPVVATPANSTSSPTVTIESTATEATPTTEVKQRWQDLDEWIDRDPSMKTISVVIGAADVRSPFVVWRNPEVIKAEKERAVLKLAEAAEVVISPVELGLELTGTVIGKEKRTAIIDGQAYGKDDTVETESGVTFKLTTIEANRVVLERKGNRFELAIRRGQLSGRVRVRGVE